MRWFPVMLMVACVPPVEPATCEGEGEPALEVGTGPRDGFQALMDGGTYQGSGSAIDLSFWTTGLDTTEPVTTVVRISVDGGATTDSIAQLTYQCADATGNGWAGASANLPAEAANGSDIGISVSTTDHLRTNATRSLSGTLSL